MFTSVTAYPEKYFWYSSSGNAGVADAAALAADRENTQRERNCSSCPRLLAHRSGAPEGLARRPRQGDAWEIGGCETLPDALTKSQHLIVAKRWFR